MDVFGLGRDPILGEPPECLLDQIEFGIEMAGAVLECQIGQNRRITPGRNELRGWHQGIDANAPQRFPAPDPRREVCNDVGDEDAGQAGLQVTLGSIVDHRSGGFDRSCGMGQVIGQDLVGIDRARFGQLPGSGTDHPGSGFDRRHSPLKIWFGHGTRQ